MPSDISVVPASLFTASGAALRPWMVVGALLLVCLIKGMATLQGVTVPPDADTVRDIGLIQGFQDGSWISDPTTEGGWRWYPPLLHAAAALVIGGLGLPLLPVWLHAGAWLNLLAPLSFYLMNRRLIGDWPAAGATAVLVLFCGVIMPTDASAGYTPWTMTPALAWPLFFGCVWLIANRLPGFRFVDAVLIGSALGLVFLAHAVPAVLLSLITTVTALVIGGARPRTLAWLAIVAVLELTWALPFLWPLVVVYHLRVANPFPGTWVHPALTDVTTLLPNVAGAGALAWLVLRRAWVSLPVVSVAILAGWIGGCAALLGRHFACEALGDPEGICRVLVVAPHHYHVYLQAAWASVMGLVLVRLCQPLRRQAVMPWLMLASVVGIVGLYAKPEDLTLHELGSTNAQMVLDRAAYDWILAETSKLDVFVTELPANDIDMGPAAATVMAAGRRLVAPPRVHSNPYLAWEPMNQRRVAFLATDADLCPLWRQGQADGGSALFLVPQARARDDLALVFSSNVNHIYRVTEAACGSGEGSENFLQRRELISGGR